MKVNKKIFNKSYYSTMFLLGLLSSCKNADYDNNMRESKYRIKEQTSQQALSGQAQSNIRNDQDVPESNCCTNLLKVCCYFLIVDEKDGEESDYEEEEVVFNQEMRENDINDPFINTISALGKNQILGQEFYIENYKSTEFTAFTISSLSDDPLLIESKTWEIAKNTILNNHPSYKRRLSCIPREAWGRSPYHIHKELVDTNCLLYIPTQLTLKDLAANNKFEINNELRAKNIFDPDGDQEIEDGKIIKMKDRIETQEIIKEKEIHPESPSLWEEAKVWWYNNISRIGAPESRVEINGELNENSNHNRTNLKNELLGSKDITFKFAPNSGLTEDLINRSIKEDYSYWISYTKKPILKNTPLNHNDMCPTVLEAMFILTHNPPLKRPILTCVEVSTNTSNSLIAVSYKKREKEFEFTAVNPNNALSYPTIAVTRIEANPKSSVCCGPCAFDAPKFCCGEGCVRLEKCYCCSIPASCTCCSKQIKCCNCSIPNCVCCICCCCCPAISGLCIYPTTKTYCERCKCCSCQEICFCFKNNNLE